MHCSSGETPEPPLITPEVANSNQGSRAPRLKIAYARGFLLLIHTRMQAMKAHVLMFHAHEHSGFFVSLAGADPQELSIALFTCELVQRFMKSLESVPEGHFPNWIEKERQNPNHSVQSLK